MTSTIKESEEEHEYELRKSYPNFGYDGRSNTILIGDVNNLNSKEVIEYVSDALTHEHIHKTLFKIFGDTTSSLFDVIGDSLRNKALLRKKVKDSVFKIRLWSDAIKKEGIIVLLEHYKLSMLDLAEATKICNFNTKHL